MTIRVGLVDDQELLRVGFAMLINSQADMTVVVEAADGVAALQRLSETPCDVVLMDIRMPLQDGVTTTEILMREVAAGSRSPLKVLVLTTFDLDQYAVNAIRAGASGFLLKDARPEELLQAIRTVHRGDAVIAATTTRRLLDTFVVPSPIATEPSHELTVAAAIAETGLTEREFEILLDLAQGFSNAEIAAKRYVSEATVKTHVSRVLNKLGVRDRVQAVIFAYDNRLLLPSD